MCLGAAEESRFCAYSRVSPYRFRFVRSPFIQAFREREDAQDVIEIVRAFRARDSTFWLRQSSASLFVSPFRNGIIAMQFSIFDL